MAPRTICYLSYYVWYSNRFIQLGKIKSEFEMVIYIHVKALRSFLQQNGNTNETLACDQFNHVATIYAGNAVGNWLH